MPIDPIEFVSASNEKRMEMIKNEPEPVIIENIINPGINLYQDYVSNSDWYFWHSAKGLLTDCMHQSIDVKLLVEKHVTLKGMCDGKPITKSFDICQIADKYNVTSNDLYEMVEKYNQKGWLTQEMAERYFLYLIHCSFKLGDINLCTQACKYATNVHNIKMILNKCLSYSYGPSNNAIICLIDFSKQNNVDINSQLQEIIHKFPSDELMSIYVKNKIPIVSQETPIEIIEKIIKKINSLENIRQIYEQFGHIVVNENIIVSLLTKYIDPEEMSDIMMLEPHLITKYVLSMVLMNGSLKTIQYLIGKGYKFENNYIHTLYVPCSRCHNSEQHSCNWRNVTDDFVCSNRFGILCNELENKCIYLTDKHFDVSYEDFITDADKDEVYILPGQGKQELNYETNLWEYEEPPKYVLKSENPPVLENLIEIYLKNQ